MQSNGVGAADISLKDLTNLELVNLQNRVAAEIQFHLLSVDADSQCASSYTLIDPPPQSANERQHSSDLLTPYSCGYKRKWCDAECTRREGHIHHSCYYCRRRRG